VVPGGGEVAAGNLQERHVGISQHG
jgi:hypothetical protein